MKAAVGARTVSPLKDHAGNTRSMSKITDAETRKETEETIWPMGLPILDDTEPYWNAVQAFYKFNYKWKVDWTKIENFDPRTSQC